MSTLKELRGRWMKDPDFRAEYEALGEEFAFAAALIDARPIATGTRLKITFEPRKA